MINVRDVTYLLDVDGTPLRSLNSRYDLSVEHVFNNNSTLTGTFPLGQEVEVEQQIIYKRGCYVITDYNVSRGKAQTSITADALYTNLSKMRCEVKQTSVSTQKLAESIVQGTEWTIGYVAYDDKQHSMTLVNEPVLGSLRLLSTISGLMLEFDTVAKTISFVESGAGNLDFLFAYKKNLQDVEKRVESPKATTLYAFGKDDITIGSINDGIDYVEDFSWYESLGIPAEEARVRFNKIDEFKDDRFIYAGNLKTEALNRLRVLAYPQITYSASVAFIDQNIKIGDYGYVWDEELGIKVNVQIVRLIEHENPADSEVELGFLIPDISDGAGTSGGGASSGGISTILNENQRQVTAGKDYITAVEINITNFASVNAVAALSVNGEASVAGLLELSVQVDGNELMAVKQTLWGAGFMEVSRQFVITQLQEGSHVLRIMARISAGTFTILKGKSTVFVQAENLDGGAGTDRPQIDIRDEITLPGYINVTDTCEITLGPSSETPA